MSETNDGDTNRLAENAMIEAAKTSLHEAVKHIDTVNLGRTEPSHTPRVADLVDEHRDRTMRLNDARKFAKSAFDLLERLGPATERTP